MHTVQSGKGSHFGMSSIESAISTRLTPQGSVTGFVKTTSDINMHMHTIPTCPFGIFTRILNGLCYATCYLLSFLAVY